MTTTTAQALTIGDTVRHPRTGREVTILDELAPEADGLRRFLVVGVRGGYDSLVLATSHMVEVAA